MIPRLGGPRGVAFVASVASLAASVSIVVAVFVSWSERKFHAQDTWHSGSVWSVRMEILVVVCSSQARKGTQI